MAAMALTAVDVAGAGAGAGAGAEGAAEPTFVAKCWATISSLMYECRWDGAVEVGGGGMSMVDGCVAAARRPLIWS